MTEKRFIIDDDGIVVDMVDLSMYIDNEDCCEKLNELDSENKELKDLLKSMADRNNEIWLDNGQIIRLKKVFNGEWTND